MIISFYNSKGGVGKTTSSLHIGASLAELGYKVLLLDFDPQLSLTDVIGLKNNKYTVLNLLNGTGHIEIRRRSDNFDVLAGDRLLHPKGLKRDSLKKALKGWKEHYDFILIDCRPVPIIPNEITLPEIALHASDYFVIPVTPNSDTVRRSLAVIDQIFESVISKHPSLNFIGFYFNIVETKRTNINKMYFEEIKAAAPKSLLESFIRKDVNVEYAAKYNKTIFQHTPNSNAARDFLSVSKEILKRIENEK